MELVFFIFAGGGLLWAHHKLEQFVNAENVKLHAQLQGTLQRIISLEQKIEDLEAANRRRR